MSNHKFKEIYLTFHVKEKIQISLLDFSWQNTDANKFIWFYLSKHKIQLNFLDFSCQKANLIWKNLTCPEPVNIDQIDFLCQNTNSNEFIWTFMSKQKFKSICWIFPVKTQMQMNSFDFTCQIRNFNSIFWIFTVKKQI